MERYAAYVRVSRIGGREGESFISTDVQRQEVERWAAGRAEIVAWHEDLDVSGGTMERPGLDEAMRSVLAGEVDGIAVARLDRFARSLSGALDAIAKLDAAGASFVSVAEGLDPTTAVGKMMMRLILVLAEFERERIAESWAVARSSAVDRGVHISPKVPVGYLRAESGRLVVDPTAAPAVTAVFVARAGGASWRELATILEQAGVRTSYGGVNWTAQSLRALVSNRAYLGEARSGEFVNSDAHQPLIDPATFARAQHKAMRAVNGSGGGLLSGILRCAGCSFTMKADHMRDRDGEKTRLYRCRGRFSFGDCSGRASVMGRVIEPWIVERFFERIPDLRLKAVDASSELAAAQEAWERAERELIAYRDAESALGAHFLAGLESRKVMLEEAEAHLADLREAAGLGEVLDLATLRSSWPELSVAERRQVLAGAIDAVFLRRVGQRNVPVGERAIVLWRGEAPADLPSLSRRGFEPREFVW